MQADITPQHVPVTIYRSAERLTIAAPMPGAEPADIRVEVADGRAVLHADLRARLKGDKQVLTEEWHVGPYHREVELPTAVDAELANVTYRNGVLVVALPITARARAARLTLTTIGPGYGERVGNQGHPIRPATQEQHEAARARRVKGTGGREASPGTPLA
jgi:HSP20 family protein